MKKKIFIRIDILKCTHIPCVIPPIPRYINRGIFGWKILRLSKIKAKEIVGIYSICYLQEWLLLIFTMGR
jgi:hypothetical protein